METGQGNAMRVMIVDDEPPARERLRSMVDELPGFEVCGEAGDGQSLLQQLATAHPDIVLLDIRMPGMDGIEAAHHLAGLPDPPAVIFTTAYGEHALEAFDAHAVAYLLKPVRKANLQRSLEASGRVTRPQLTELARSEDRPTARTHICARLRGNLKLVPVDEILYFQADEKYVTVRHLEGEVLIEESLSQLEQEFGERLLRIHRSILVNVDYIDRLEKDEDGKTRLGVRGCDEALAVSRRHLPRVRRRLREMAI